MTIFWISWVKHIIKINSTSCFFLLKAITRKCKITTWLKGLLGRIKQTAPGDQETLMSGGWSCHHYTE